MIGKLNEYMGFNEAALGLRAQRQQLLASNIANADTPNYKARDIDFASALQAVVAKNSGAPPAGVLAQTAPAHMLTSTSGDFLPNGTPVHNARQPLFCQRRARRAGKMLADQCRRPGSCAGPRRLP